MVGFSQVRGGILETRVILKTCWTFTKTHCGRVSSDISLSESDVLFVRYLVQSIVFIGSPTGRPDPSAILSADGQLLSTADVKDLHEDTQLGP